MTCSCAGACSTLSGFALSGPKARTVLERLADFDVSNEAFKFFAVREGAVGLSPAIVQRCGFTGSSASSSGSRPISSSSSMRRLAAGEDLGLAHYGGRAISSLRLEKNYGSFNKDFRPDYTPAETGLDAFVDFTKNVDFTGRAAVLAEKERGPAKRFVTFAVDAPHADVVGYEVVLKDGEPVGHVTSGGYGHWVGTSLAVGYVPAALAVDGGVFAIDILGQECRAVITARPLHDPEGARLRS